MPLSHAIVKALTSLTDPFWFPNVLAPVILLVVAQFVRARETGTLTTGADAMLALATYDLVVICSAAEFSVHIVSSDLQSRVVPLHVFFGVVAGLAWYVLVKWGEPALRDASARSVKAWCIGLGGLLVFVMLVAVHVVAYRGVA